MVEDINVDLDGLRIDTITIKEAQRDEFAQIGRYRQ